MVRMLLPSSLTGKMNEMLECQIDKEHTKKKKNSSTTCATSSSSRSRNISSSPYCRTRTRTGHDVAAVPITTAAALLAEQDDPCCYTGSSQFLSCSPSSQPLYVVSGIARPSALNHDDHRCKFFSRSNSKNKKDDDNHNDDEEDERQQVLQQAVDDHISSFYFDLQQQEENEDESRQEQEGDHDYRSTRRSRSIEDEKRNGPAHYYYSSKLRHSNTSTSSYETFSFLLDQQQHPRREQERNQHAYYRHPHEENQNETVEKNLVVENDKRLEVEQVPKLHGMPTSPSSSSSPSFSSSSFFYPSDQNSRNDWCHKKYLNCTNGTHHRTSCTPFSKVVWHQAGDATTATRSLSLESSHGKGSTITTTTTTPMANAMQQTLCNSCQCGGNGKQRRYCYNDDIPVVLLIKNNSKEDFDDGTLQEEQLSATTPISDKRKGRMQRKNYQSFEGNRDCGIKNDNNYQSAGTVVTTRVDGNHMVEDSNHMINPTLSTAKNKMVATAATNKSALFGRLAECTTKSYSLRQRASSKMRNSRGTSTTTPPRHLSRDPSPLHERLAHHETYSSSLKRTHKSPEKVSSHGRPFYTYVNPKSAENSRTTTLPPSNSFDVAAAVLSSPSRRQSAGDADGFFLSRRRNPSLDHGVPHNHSMSPIRKNATSNHVVRMRRSNSFTMAQEHWQQCRPQLPFKVRDPSPMRIPFRTLVTAGSFKGDDISEITDNAVVRLHGGAGMANPRDPTSCDALSRPSVPNSSTPMSSSSSTQGPAANPSPVLPALVSPTSCNKHTEENDTSKVKQQQEDDVLYFNAKKINQRRKDLESKRNNLYYRLTNQDTVSSSRMKSKPQGEKILSTSFEKKMIVEEEKAAVIDARRRHRTARVQQPDQEVFERLMTRGMEAALKNQMVVAKLVQEQKEWMQKR